MKKILSILLVFIIFTQTILFNTTYAYDNGVSLGVIPKFGQFTVSPDGNEIIYYNNNDGYFYKKSSSDDSIGTNFMNPNGTMDPTYAPDGTYFITTGGIGGSNIRKTGINDTSIGTPITTIGGLAQPSAPTFSYDGNSIIYVNNYGGNLLYKKNANDTSIGSAITTIGVQYPTYSPDGTKILYVNYNDGSKLYLKNADDNSNGVAINNVASAYPNFSPDGTKIIYRAGPDWMIYEKNVDDTEKGTKLNSNKAKDIIVSKDGKYIYYINWDDGDTLYRITRPTIPVIGNITSPASATDNIDLVVNGITDPDINGTLTYSFSFDETNYNNLTMTGSTPVENGTQNLNIDLSSQPDGNVNVYVKANDGSGDSNVVSTTIYKTTAPVIDSVTSTQSDINLGNFNSLELSLSGITDTNSGETLSYSYSFDNTNFTSLSGSTIAPVTTGSYNFDLDISNQADGDVTIYVKTNDGYFDSNIVSITLNKDTQKVIPNSPTEFLTKNIMSGSVGYTWIDNSNLLTNNEDKFIIKDENNDTIVDNIQKDTTSINESGLSPNTNYQRKICAMNNEGEACSDLVSFKTPAEVTGGKTTTYSFAGINIDVVETLEMFKVVFSIGGFRINFSIEVA